MLTKLLKALQDLFKSKPKALPDIVAKPAEPPPGSAILVTPPHPKAEDTPLQPHPTPSAGSLGWYEALIATAQASQGTAQQDLIGWAKRKALMGKARYQAVEALTGVPWDLIAAIHHMEASFSFDGVLHNGEHIIGKGLKTILVPKGRGPFASWEDAAADALNLKGLKHITDWTLARKLQVAEQYNGLGYLRKGLMSPYVWSLTNHYTKGLYVADGKFDPEAVSKRPGVCAILLALRE